MSTQPYCLPLHTYILTQRGESKSYCCLLPVQRRQQWSVLSSHSLAQTRTLSKAAHNPCDRERQHICIVWHNSWEPGTEPKSLFALQALISFTCLLADPGWEQTWIYTCLHMKAVHFSPLIRASLTWTATEQNRLSNHQGIGQEGLITNYLFSEGLSTSELKAKKKKADHKKKRSQQKFLARTLHQLSSFNIWEPREPQIIGSQTCTQHDDMYSTL